MPCNCCHNMCSRTQYKHNVRAAAQCVEVSWTSAFLLPRALTGRTFSSLRSFSIERHPTRYDLHVSILQELFVVHLLFSLSWNVSPGFGSEKLGWFGVRGGGLPSADYLASFDQLHSCTALLLSLSLILQQLRLSCWLRKQERNCERL